MKDEFRFTHIDESTPVVYTAKRDDLNNYVVLWGESEVKYSNDSAREALRDGVWIEVKRDEIEPLSIIGNRNFIIQKDGLVSDAEKTVGECLLTISNSESSQILCVHKSQIDNLIKLLKKAKELL